MAKQCIACAETIPDNAKLCQKCKSHQKAWRNEIKYWASAAGLTTLILSAITLTSSLGYGIYYFLFMPTIAAMEIDTFGESSITNLTKYDVNIYTIRIKSQNPRCDLQWGIYKTIAPNKPFTFNLTDYTKKQWHGTVAKLYSDEKIGNYALDLPSDDVHKFKYENLFRDKYVVGFLYKYGPEFQQLNGQYKNRLSTCDCSIEIKYMAATDNDIQSQYLPCIGVIRHVKASK